MTLHGVAISITVLLIGHLLVHWLLVKLQQYADAGGLSTVAQTGTAVRMVGLAIIWSVSLDRLGLPIAAFWSHVGRILTTPLFTVAKTPVSMVSFGIVGLIIWGSVLVSRWLSRYFANTGWTKGCLSPSSG